MDRKAVARRFVEEAVNGGRDDLIGELFAPEMEESAREWFGAFRASFPDVHMDVVELVAEGDTVVGRFECSATHLGEWRGNAPTGRRFEKVDEVYFFPFSGVRFASAWGFVDTLDRFNQLGRPQR
jgi:predicted ester cyclase